MTRDPRKFHEEGATILRIKMPLPISVTGALMGALAQMWPEGQIITDEAADLPYGPTFMSFRLPDTPPETPAEPLTPAQLDEVLDGWVFDFQPGGMVLGPSEAFGTWLASKFWGILMDTPAAVNYLQMAVIDKKTDQVLNILLLRPGGKSPHELREDAEAHVARLEAQLREAGLEPVE